MLRKISAGLLVLAVGLAPLGANAAADPENDPKPQSKEALLATESLKTAVAAREGKEVGRDVSLAMADLFARYDSLSPSEKKQADALLARPTDGANDPLKDGYTVREARPICGPHVCIHYVKTTGDAPSSTDSDGDGRYDWAEYSLKVMESVWRKEVGQLKYRAPASDGRRGGNKKFDVYLSDVGNDGLYGYCTTEYRVPGQKFRASGYCVLDEDFVEFEPQPRAASLKVTAAHEFFHAIQYNYDYDEDRWAMEATATWMEERYADSVNDNRQYLGYGQVRRNDIPLDKFSRNSLVQYGNWIFFEGLSLKYGTGAVRQIWNRLAASGQSRGKYSVKGVHAFLATKKMTLPRFYAAFGAVNIVPQKVYPEGSAYPRAKVAKTYTLTRSRPGANGRATLAHLTNRNYSFVPTTGFSGQRKLRIIVNAPNKNTGVAAWVLVHMADGKLISKEVKLNSRGWGKVSAAYTRGKVSRVTLTLANANTSYRCWKGTGYACKGQPLGDGKVFKFNVRNVAG